MSKMITAVILGINSGRQAVKRLKVAAVVIDRGSCGIQSWKEQWCRCMVMGARTLKKNRGNGVMVDGTDDEWKRVLPICGNGLKG